MIKEQLVEIVRKEGYGFFSACEIVTKAMKNLKPGKNILTIGKIQITINKEVSHAKS